MSWSAAFYFGGSAGQTVFVPIETAEFDVAELAEFAVLDPVPVFAVAVDVPAFDFTGAPVFEPIEEDTQFDVQC